MSQSRNVEIPILSDGFCHEIIAFKLKIKFTSLMKASFLICCFEN